MVIHGRVLLQLYSPPSRLASLLVLRVTGLGNMMEQKKSPAAGVVGLSKAVTDSAMEIDFRANNPVVSQPCANTTSRIVFSRFVSAAGANRYSSCR